MDDTMSEGKSPELEAPELLAEAGKHPTLDEMMRRDPADHDETTRERLEELLRQERPIFIKAEAERKRR